MNVSSFHVKGMDCPSEEQLIRFKLTQLPEVRNIEIDLAERRVNIYHEGNPDRITRELIALGLDAEYQQTQKAIPHQNSEDTKNQRTILWLVLMINLGFFLIELITGIISRSMGLVADSLDMLADAIVYGLSLIAIGSTIRKKKTVAAISGVFQAFLAIAGFLEVVRRFFATAEPPDYRVMMVVSGFALIANLITLSLLRKTGTREVHLKASWIFTTNDILANLGVILASVLVLLIDSNRPDLLIGAIIFVLVMRGAWRILQLAR